MNKKLVWPTELYSFKNVNIDNDKIKKIILENVEKREADHGTFYVFTMKITDETGNDNTLAFFSNDKNGLDFIKKDNS